MVGFPPCGLLDRCERCTRMGLPADEQREQKLADVARMLRREPDGFVASPRALGYRARIVVHRTPEGWGYRSPGSHVATTISGCAIARPEVDRVLGTLPPANVDEVEIRSNGSEVVVVALGRAPASDWVDAVSALPQVVGVAHGARAVRGRVDLSFPFADGKRRDVGPTTFFQVNLELNEILVSAVLERVRATEPHAVLDLFAGAGNFGLPLLAAGTPVTAIESDTSAVRDLERAIAAHALPGAKVIRADANRFTPGEAFYDVAVLDPPRAGAPGLLERLAVTRPSAILYVSCNARTLGRDLGHLRGYAVEEVVVFDMFPQTEHAEVLAVLGRR
jgi:23S rRNA (uracil1939-C5)-methyltransferase